MKLNIDKTAALGSTRHMLDTLHLAYQYVLGEPPINSLPGTKNTKLSVKQQKELGNRLAQYRTYKIPMDEFYAPQKSSKK